MPQIRSVKAIIAQKGQVKQILKWNGGLETIDNNERKFQISGTQRKRMFPEIEGQS